MISIVILNLITKYLILNWYIQIQYRGILKDFSTKREVQKKAALIIHTHLNI